MNDTSRLAPCCKGPEPLRLPDFKELRRHTVVKDHFTCVVPGCLVMHHSAPTETLVVGTLPPSNIAIARQYGEPHPVLRDELVLVMDSDSYVSLFGEYRWIPETCLCSLVLDCYPRCPVHGGDSDED